MATALITWGGWDGHEPDKVAALCGSILSDAGMACTIVDHLDCFSDPSEVAGYDLIVPVWTMSQIDKEKVVNVSEAVARGTGLAGVHGGMCDAFRDQVLWQFMTGANWVSHPGGDGVQYTVNIANSSSPLVEGLHDFDVNSEQYYLHVDLANEVLATTRFPTVNWYHSPNGAVDIPVAWTRRWGLGRVYYNALGHQANVIDHGPAFEMIKRGLLWAAQGRAAAKERGERYEDYANDGSHY